MQKAVSNADGLVGVCSGAGLRSGNLGLNLLKPAPVCPVRSRRYGFAGEGLVVGEHEVLLEVPHGDELGFIAAAIDEGLSGDEDVISKDTERSAPYHKPVFTGACSEISAFIDVFCREFAIPIIVSTAPFFYKLGKVYSSHLVSNMGAFILWLHTCRGMQDIHNYYLSCFNHTLFPKFCQHTLTSAYIVIIFQKKFPPSLARNELLC